MGANSVEEVWSQMRGDNVQRVVAVLSRHIGWGVIMILVGLFVTKADIALGLREVLPVDPSVLFVAFSVMVFGYVVTVKAAFNRFLRVVRRCAPVTVAFTALVCVGLIGSFRGIEAANGEYRPVFFPVFDFFVFVTGMAIGSIGISDSTRRYWLGVAFGVSVVSIAIDIVYPGTFSISAHRAAGLAINPNGGAFVLLLLMVSLLGWNSRKAGKRDAVVLCLGLIGVAATLSRVGVVLYVVIIGLYMFYSQGRLVRKISVMASAIGMSSVFAIGIWSAVGSGDEAITRIVASRFLVGDAFRVSEDDSVLQRAAATEKSIEMIAEAPFSGHGTGASYRMNVGPHSMYLAAWVDNGVLGVMSYLALVIMMVRVNYTLGNTEGVVLALLMALFSFVSHNVLEDRTLFLLVAISMASASLAQSKRVSEVSGVDDGWYSSADRVSVTRIQ